MPEYTWDPSIGDAVPTSQLHPANGGGEVETDFQAQANRASARSFENTARHLAQRSQDQSPGINPNNLDHELELQSVMAEIHQLTHGNGAHNPLKLLQLQQKAEVLAAAATGEGLQQKSPEEFNQDWTEADLRADQETELANDPRVQASLNFAASEFDQDVSAAINERLETATAVEMQSTVTALNQIRENPHWIGQGEEVTQIDNTAIRRIAERWDQSTADDIATINAAMANGIATKADAMKLAMRSPRTLNAILWAAKNDLIKLAVS